jgi:hypothetical protein
MLFMTKAKKVNNSIYTATVFGLILVLFAAIFLPYFGDAEETVMSKPDAMRMSYIEEGDDTMTVTEVCFRDNDLIILEQGAS